MEWANSPLNIREAESRVDVGAALIVEAKSCSVENGYSQENLNIKGRYVHILYS